MNKQWGPARLTRVADLIILLAVACVGVLVIWRTVGQSNTIDDLESDDPATISFVVTMEDLEARPQQTAKSLEGLVGGVIVYADRCVLLDTGWFEHELMTGDAETVRAKAAWAAELLGVDWREHATFSGYVGPNV